MVTALLRMAFVTAVFAAGAIAASAQSFTTVATFEGPNGNQPMYVSLVQGTDGYLYGTTVDGGLNSRGTVFKVSRTGNIKVLYNFCSQSNCADGAWPYSGVVQGWDGAFYGTTTGGGVCASGFNCGTVFKLTALGALTALHEFCSEALCSDGSFPVASLVQANNGNFYGTTQSNGEGAGTIFAITPQGALTTLGSLGGPLGYWPFGAMIQANDGDLYGTTSGGGAYCGTVFKMPVTGSPTVLFDFEGGGAGAGCTPYGTLLQGSDGLFYGTSSSYPGIAFRMTPAGIPTHLYGFPSSEADPYSGFVQGPDGNLYGTTYYGGSSPNCAAYGCGTVYQMTPDGTVTILHTFDLTDGAHPDGGLLLATNGLLYGTTSEGGNPGVGTIYSINMGFAPFISFLRNYGRVGQAAGILGQGFAGTTSVSFNGVQAPFTVGSDSFIRATVPVGAATGSITVTSSGGTLTSIIPFRVLP